MDTTPVTLRGTHVILEPLLPEHASELWTAADDADLWRYMPTPMTTPADLDAWIRARRAGLADGSALPFLQRDAVSGAAIGSTSFFDIDTAHRRLEIGHTWIARTHRRTGVNTEAKRALLAHAFDVMGANRVQLKTDSRNEASQRAMTRIGATREGVLRAHMMLPDGHVRDSVIYSIVRGEWPAVRARLDGLLRPRVLG